MVPVLVPVLVLVLVLALVLELMLAVVLLVLVLELVLDRGEPEAMVLPGLEREGHAVSVQETTDDWLRLHVICAGG